MNQQSPRALLPIALAIVSLFPLDALACSACGCSLDSDWSSQGSAPATRVLSVDVRYDYLNQTQLRRGTGKVDKASLALPNDDEIQQQTRNRVLTTTVDYAVDSQWGVSMALPYVDRFHTTIAPGDTNISASKSSSLGDVRLLARYDGLGGAAHTGVQFGLKLPTGSIHTRFSDGPQAGEALDRGLQPGTGTTDLIVGLYHAGALNDQLGYFGKVQVQQALNTRDEFKPSNKLNLSLGLRYTANEQVTPQLQLNLASEGRESGTNADRDNSGSVLAYLSPGVSVSVSKQVQVYGFVQLPVYQHVNGLQLEPKSTASLGLRFSL